MTVGELRRILDLLPDDTHVCQAEGEDGCSVMCEARYYPQYSILYLDKSWPRESKGLPNHFVLASQMRCGDNDVKLLGLGSDEFDQIHRLCLRGKDIIDEKNDRKIHQVQVIRFKTDDSVAWKALFVDGECVNGVRTDVGEKTEKTVLCDFVWKSLGPGYEGQGVEK